MKKIFQILFFVSSSILYCPSYVAKDFIKIANNGLNLQPEPCMRHIVRFVNQTNPSDVIQMELPIYECLNTGYLVAKMHDENSLEDIYLLSKRDYEYQLALQQNRLLIRMIMPMDAEEFHNFKP